MLCHCMILPSPYFTAGVELTWWWAVPDAHDAWHSHFRVPSLSLQTRKCWFSYYQSPSGSFCLLLRDGFSIMETCMALYHAGLIGGLLQRWLSFLEVLLFLQRNSGALTQRPSGSWSPLRFVPQDNSLSEVYRQFLWFNAWCLTSDLWDFL